MNAFISSKSLPAIAKFDQEECGIRASRIRRIAYMVRIAQTYLFRYMLRKGLVRAT